MHGFKYNAWRGWAQLAASRSNQTPIDVCGQLVNPGDLPSAAAIDLDTQA
ncbi:hypothetical protein SynBIOSE41_01457 [Synechococcus sp. BIOS-E4-1]|nr:hypothetical protein SynBIOSE41_01457 [Synechococcus sp. BIOS-E4-1]